MALTPDTGETFLREVDENLRRDQLRSMARKYAPLWIAAVVLLLAAVGGWLYWQDKQKRMRPPIPRRWPRSTPTSAPAGWRRCRSGSTALARDGTDAVRASALFTRAAVAIEQNDRALAAAKYHEVANDKGLPAPYRDLGLIRATTLEFDGLKPDQVIARMEPIAKPGNPWFGSAGELTAMAMIKQGRKLEAGRLFAAVAADRQAPESIRARAVQIAGTLGVDASASLPAPAQ